MKELNLGCGRDYKAGCYNLDYCDRYKVDGILDLNDANWGLESKKYEVVYALDVVEHLDDLINFMNNCHDIIKQGGKLIIKTPHKNSDNSWTDPTHKLHLTEYSLNYFCMGTDLQIKYWLTDKMWKMTMKAIDRDYNIIFELEPIVDGYIEKV